MRWRIEIETAWIWKKVAALGEQSSHWRHCDDLLRASGKAGSTHPDGGRVVSCGNGIAELNRNSCHADRDV